MNLPNCEICGHSMSMEKALVWVSMAEAWEGQIKTQEWERRHSGELVMQINSLPSRAAWFLTHTSCSTEGVTYDFEVSRIDTPLKALHWLMHLDGKNWFPHTNFDRVIELLYPDVWEAC